MKKLNIGIKSKLLLIHIADMFDNYILRHNYYSICEKVTNSNWWGKEPHTCVYCKQFDMDYLDD